MSAKLTKNSIAFQKVTFVLKVQNLHSLTVNPTQTLLYIQVHTKILILQFFSRVGQIKMLGVPLRYYGGFSFLQRLTGPVFMKKQKQFFTADFSYSIVLWTFDQKVGWKIAQQLQGHEKGVTCLILNNDEDKLISGSIDKTIRFWNKADHWQCKQTIIVDQAYFDDLSLSLNQTESKLIVWIIKHNISFGIQKIRINLDRLKLCFLNDKQFILQLKGDQIASYKQDELDLQFKQHNLIQTTQGVESSLRTTIKYTKKLNLLLIKRGRVVNLVKYTDQEELKILQQIQFQTDGIATISDDARYLIVEDGDPLAWKNVGSKILQIIMFKQFD